MEYLAFGLLALGTIFIFIGILSARDKAVTPVFGESMTQMTSPAPVSAPTQTMSPKQADDLADFRHPPLHQNTLINERESAAGIRNVMSPSKPDSTFHTTTPAESRNEPGHPSLPLTRIPFTSSTEPALLFSRETTLYIDKSGSNLYESSRKNPTLLNSAAIHRIGPGDLSFNGYSFFFKNKKGKETLPLAEIEKMGFFPNCVTITRKQSSSTMIFFIDNTMQLKSLLDQHLTPHAIE